LNCSNLLIDFIRFQLIDLNNKKKETGYRAWKQKILQSAQINDQIRDQTNLIKLLI